MFDGASERSAAHGFQIYAHATAKSFVLTGCQCAKSHYCCGVIILEYAGLLLHHGDEQKEAFELTLRGTELVKGAGVPALAGKDMMYGVCRNQLMVANHTGVARDLRLAQFSQTLVDEESCLCAGVEAALLDVAGVSHRGAAFCR